MARSTQVQLVSRPQGWPTADDVRTVHVDLPELAEGEVRVENEFVSVDPYMRGRMSDARSYVAPYELGETMTGAAVGRVVASRSDTVSEGDLVIHEMGWRDVAQGDASRFRVVQPIDGVPSSAYLGALGMTGFTAYAGLLHVARMQAGDTVFVSGAAGAVGSMVGQIASLKGAGRVVGSAGSDEKVAALTERYRYDAGFSYRSGDVMELLREAAPDGIDVYFDNVGGDHLEAALDSFNDGGRAALCGAISQYNSTEKASGPGNMANIVTRRLTLQGFIVGYHQEHMPAFLEEMGGWVAAGDVRLDETVVDGIENTFDAFLGLMRGENTGKMVVRV